MTDSALVVEQEDGLTRLLLNRPQKRNALSAELVEQLICALGDIDPDVTQLLVIQGNGKGFCAGFDFSDMDKQSDAELVHRFIRIEQMLQAFHHAPCMTLALAHNACFGAGADIFAACKKRIAAPATRFRMPGLQFGVELGTRRLSELIGSQAALDLLETSEVFDSTRAASVGLVNQVLAEDQWAAAAQSALENANALSAGSQAKLLQATLLDNRDRDLAALVRSVATPGLGSRIRDFLAKG